MCKKIFNGPVKFMEGNYVFATNYDFLIPISLQPNGLDLRYFRLMNSVRSNNVSLNYHRFLP